MDAFLLLGVHLGPRWVVAVYDYRPLYVRDQLAVRNHLVVTTGESQRALSMLARQTGRSGPAFVQLAVANGLAPDMLPDLGRYEAIQNEELTRLNGGTLPRTQARVQVLSPEFSRRGAQPVTACLSRSWAAPAAPAEVERG